MRFLPLFLLGLGCLPALALASTPEDAAQAFYAARLASETMGAPGGLELADFSQYLGPELVCVLGAARRYNDAYLEARPGEVPPFAHGDLYSGAEERPARFTLGKASVKGERATISARFEYDGADGHAFERSSTLHMLLHKRHWVINEIDYTEAPVIPMPKPGLVAGLREALDHGNPEIGWSARQLDGCPVDGELARLKAAQVKKESAGKKKHATAKRGTNHSARSASSTKKAAAPAKSSPKKAASGTAHKKAASSSKAHARK
ncbi:hypothetical protein ACFONG_00335 [Uliginosibacterium paludis]|uniref:DUF4440 domain-containing protein n=1 Tax=Uliginosibacterium paludis TaxID=1615952 RepID=A0ABV2CR88_9RHOO